MKNAFNIAIMAGVIIYFIVVAIGASELQTLQKEESTLHIKVLKLQLGE